MYLKAFPSSTDCYVPRNASLTASLEFRFILANFYWIFFPYSISTKGYKGNTQDQMRHIPFNSHLHFLFPFLNFSVQYLLAHKKRGASGRFTNSNNQIQYLDGRNRSKPKKITQFYQMVKTTNAQNYVFW